VNHARLREIARAAKGHWGYDPQFVADWAAAIEFPDDERLIVAAHGWAAVVPRGEVAWLDDLWVEPDAMGRGLGRELFERAAAIARDAGCVRMEWEAEPNALGFYERLGAVYVRDSEPSEWGRVLAVMAVSLVG
jgi:GNAT superfamily N-acetyltransferase